VTIRYYFRKPITPDVRGRLVLLLSNLNETRLIQVPHFLPVHVVPAPAVSDGEGGYGFAAFAWRPTPRVFLAGDVKEIAAGTSMDHQEALEMLEESFIHELVHYEQWRDGRKIQERGVAVRTRNIHRKIKEATAA